MSEHSAPGADASDDIRRAMATACHRLHARGLIGGAEGNISVRESSGVILVTPAGVDKATVQPEQMVRVALHASGTIRHVATLESPPSGSAGDSAVRPSSEVEMHLACYRARPDVGAIVHAHPPAATGFAAAGRGMPDDVLPELPVVVGPIALVPYGRPGTAALPEAMAPFIGTHEVFLLANHGVTAMGSSLAVAVQRMESVEQGARILLVAQLLGGAQRLDADEVRALKVRHGASVSSRTDGT
jgi:L-fuculose-phosphate aldolase